MVKLISPKNNSEVEIQTNIQKDFVNSAKINNNLDWLNLEKSGMEDRTFPKKLTLCWETDSEDSVVKISICKDFENCTVFKVNAKSLEIGNLLSGQEYFWCVNDSEVFRFVTEDVAPRWIKIDGLSNIRDTGAWKTEDGKRIKQGLIFRGSEMNKHHIITEEGLIDIHRDMKIKTDLDIRGEKEAMVTSSPAGDSVEFYLIPVAAYSEFLSEEQKPRTKQLFEILADETKYPIYYHCWGGADRTGTIAFMLGSILGVKFEDLLLDYELTSLSVWGDRSRNSDLWKSLIEQLNKYGDSEDPRKNVISFLHSCGITDEIINKIRKNLIEE